MAAPSYGERHSSIRFSSRKRPKLCLSLRLRGRAAATLLPCCRHTGDVLRTAPLGAGCSVPMGATFSGSSTCGMVCSHCFQQRFLQGCQVRVRRHPQLGFLSVPSARVGGVSVDALTPRTPVRSRLVRTRPVRSRNGGGGFGCPHTGCLPGFISLARGF